MDWDLFDRFCYLQCTLDEIAFGLGCSTDTIERHCKSERQMGFAEYYRKRSAGGKVALRRRMWEVALNKKRPNANMQIWLSKQHLDMKESPEPVTSDDGDIIYDVEWGTIGTPSENDKDLPASPDAVIDAPKPGEV